MPIWKKTKTQPEASFEPLACGNCYTWASQHHLVTPSKRSTAKSRKKNYLILEMCSLSLTPQTPTTNNYIFTTIKNMVVSEFRLRCLCPCVFVRCLLIFTLCEKHLKIGAVSGNFANIKTVSCGEFFAVNAGDLAPCMLGMLANVPRLPIVYTHNNEYHTMAKNRWREKRQWFWGHELLALHWVGVGGVKIPWAT